MLRALRIPLLVLSLFAVAPGAHGAKAQQQHLTALQKGSFQARIDAIAALKASKEPGAFDAIVGALKDRDATVRWAACEALEELGRTDAIPALQKAVADPSPLVANRARAAVAALQRAERGVVGPPVIRLQAKDASGIGGLEGLLANSVQSGLARSQAVKRGDDDAGYVAQLTVQQFKERREGAERVLELTCTATVQELPGGQLRFATRIGAAASQAGALTDADRRALAKDIVASVGDALGEEIAVYFAQR